MHTYSKRTIRFATNDISREINFVSGSVSFRRFDENGATKRFYRQVHLRQVTDPTTKRESYQIFLDHRVLQVEGEIILIDSYELALAIQSEFEFQGEYIRLESMPLTSYAVTLLQRTYMSVIPQDLRRQSSLGAFRSYIDSDLLRMAENPKLNDINFYENNWQPILDWFNKYFSSNIEYEYHPMYGEEDDPDILSKAINPNEMANLDTEDLVSKMKLTEIGQKIAYFQERVKQEGQLKELQNLGTSRKFLKELDDTRLWILDEMIHLSRSPIISIALLLNALALEDALRAISVPELQTSIHDEASSSLSLNQILVGLASARNFLNFYDMMSPMNNSYAKIYKTPVIKTTVDKSKNINLQMIENQANTSPN